MLTSYKVLFTVSKEMELTVKKLISDLESTLSYDRIPCSLDAVRAKNCKTY